VSEVGRASPAITGQLQLLLLLILQCAEMAGASDRVFAMTTQYAADRYAFGRPLTSYQSLKHRFADMKTTLEASQAATSAAAAAVGTRPSTTQGSPSARSRWSTGASSSARSSSTTL
jgi:alkylation response protein AidB-like acyl-CoA dehydrogenase